MQRCQKLMRFGVIINRWREKCNTKRKELYSTYFALLDNIDAINVIKFDQIEYHIYSYMPIKVLNSKKHTRDGLHKFLKSRNIFSRRYFYPLITETPQFKHCKISGDIPVASKIIEQLLWLPIHPGLDSNDIHHICDNVRQYFSDL